MSLLNRIRNLGRAQFEGWTGKAEADEDALRATANELEKAVEAARSSLAEYAAVFKRAEQELAELTARSERWQTQAEAALRANDEAAARQALAEKRKAEQRRARCAEDVGEKRRTYEALRAEVRTLQERRDEAQRHAKEWEARHRAADARLAIGRHADRAQTDGDAARRMEENTLATESAADIEREIRQRDSLAGRLDQMEETRAVDEDLAVLRQKLAREEENEAQR